MSYLVARFRHGVPWYKYEISMRVSYRENGKVKKKETYLMTYNLIGVSNKYPHPQLDRVLEPQWRNIRPTHIHFFTEDLQLMNKIIAKVRNAEIKRKQAKVRTGELEQFWYERIKALSDKVCNDKANELNFFHFVNRCYRLYDNHKRNSKNFYYDYEQEITDKIIKYHKLFVDQNREQLP